ncbi:MAG: pseudaminic acid cytidylyltransferase [Oceanotoga sp.]|uniref:pseudaminic acid cytidylyltransferase n=1 Tax=Oceanotoga sp. TaxID=2108366 RepID=UPI00264EBBF6|nr:pseudaminic acid cytidylyltransferase [Oceanotoga sp.]MDN5341368.1 pseudaminic acid cytidylyltransferase [Oceanotoga sp.]
MKKIAIIPARGGSKRIPKKNIRDFLGKPIIAYSIEAAIKSDIFDEVMVSTDSEEIAEIAKRYGAKVPFLRSEKSADDHAPLIDVAKEVLENYKNKGIDFDKVCMILPTAPFVDEQKLKKANEILEEKNVDTVFTVTEYSFPIQRSLRIENGYLKMKWPENMNKRSQDLEKTYHDAGQFYFFDVKEFYIQNKVYMEKSYPIILDNIEVQDIDTETDWKLAELKYRLINNLEE